jgi:hypothetical protein
MPDARLDAPAPNQRRHARASWLLWALCTGLTLFTLLEATRTPRARGSASEKTAIEHGLRALDVGGHHFELHRFRVPLARVNIELVNLGFTRPLASALDSADLVINGGFWEWHEHARRIQGWLVARGRVFSPLDRELGGGALLIAKGRAQVVEVAGAATMLAADFALQCRPRLVDHGTRIASLNASARAARTAVCVRDDGKVLDLYLSADTGPGPTLRELADYLVSEGCESALNLDGGPSTAAAWRDATGVAQLGAGRELPYALRFASAKAR